MWISVIIPVYNCSDYLARCVKSILAQTYQHWEMILVDDGSTDGVGGMCDDLAETDCRIKVIHQQNKGASIARQVGITFAKGDFLSFVDADDWVEPDYFERLYNALIDNTVDIAACDYIKQQEGESIEIDRHASYTILEYKELHQRFFKYEFWGFWGKLYKKEVFDGIYFPKATINEDYVVMAQLFHKCRRMAYVPISLYHYMMHEGSLSNLQLNMRMLEEWENKKWALSYYNGLDTSQWKSYAEAQAAETCCKLIGAISNGGNPEEYLALKCEMQGFLQSHLVPLLFSKQLILGLKCMCLKRAFE